MSSDLLLFILFIAMTAFVMLAIFGAPMVRRRVHGRFTKWAMYLAPLLMMDELFRNSGTYTSMTFLLGMFQFVPALLGAFIYLGIRAMTVKDNKSGMGIGKHFIIPGLLVGCQLVFLIQPAEFKIQLYSAPLAGNLKTMWPFYTFLSISYFTALIYCAMAHNHLNNYHARLPEQVAEVDDYKLMYLQHLLTFIVVAYFLCIGMCWLSAFDSLYNLNWEGVAVLIQIVPLFMFLALCIEGRKFSPNPLSKKPKKYSQEEMQNALIAADRAVIRTRAYKVLGVRLDDICKAGNIPPDMLAQALKQLMRTSFRAFIGKYRLEYAKKLLLMTNMKISVVAKKLGFKSELYLAEVFEKYMNLNVKQMQQEKEKHKSDVVDWE